MRLAYVDESYNRKTYWFGAAHHDGGLQAVDLVAFLHQRRYEGSDTNPLVVQAKEQLWAIVEPHVNCMEGP